MDNMDQLLDTYKKVILVGHSMGTLFSIRNAVKHPDKVPFLFLLAVPTRPWVRFSTVRACLRATAKKAGKEDPVEQRLKYATSVQIVRSRRQYLCWIPRFLELLKEIRQVRRLIPELKVPCYTFQSRVDELVSFRSCKDLAKNPCITNTMLEEFGHLFYSPGDTVLLQDRLKALVQTVLEGGAL